jgi:thioredoxin reductase (NADPH)
MVDRARDHPTIDAHPNLAVDEVLGTSKVEGVRVRDTVNGETSVMPVDGLFIAIGYEPNTAAFRDWLEVDEKGYLVVHDETGSKIDGVFIAGDVHDHRYRQAVTAAGDGCKAAIDAERWLEAQGITEVATATAW